MLRFLTCLGALLALSACGTKGPLYLPAPTAKPKPAAPAPAVDHNTAPKVSTQ